MEILKCPYCNEAWLYVSDGGHTSGYESNGYKMSCRCHFAWQNTEWKPTKEETIIDWNKKSKRENNHVNRSTKTSKRKVSSKE